MKKICSNDSKKILAKYVCADFQYAANTIMRNIIIDFDSKAWERLSTIIKVMANPIITDNLTEKCLNHHKIELEVEQKYDDGSMLSYYIQVKQRGEYITPRMHFYIPKLNYETK